MAAEEQKLIDIYKFYNKCMKEKDLKGFDEFSTKDFILVHMDGKVESRAQYLDDIKIGNLIYYNTTHDSIKVEFKGDDTAVLKGKTQLDADPYHTGRTIYRVESTCDFKKINGKWMIIKVTTHPY